MWLSLVHDSKIISFKIIKGSKIQRFLTCIWSISEGKSRSLLTSIWVLIDRKQALYSQVCIVCVMFKFTSKIWNKLKDQEYFSWRSLHTSINSKETLERSKHQPCRRSTSYSKRWKFNVVVGKFFKTLHYVSCHRTEDTVKSKCSHILFQRTVRLPGKPRTIVDRDGKVPKQFWRSLWLLVTITLRKVRSLRILGSLLKGLVSKTGKDRDMKLKTRWVCIYPNIYIC